MITKNGTVVFAFFLFLIPVVLSGQSYKIIAMKDAGGIIRLSVDDKIKKGDLFIARRQTANGLMEIAQVEVLLLSQRHGLVHIFSPISTLSLQKGDLLYKDEHNNKNGTTFVDQFFNKMGNSQTADRSGILLPESATRYNSPRRDFKKGTGINVQVGTPGLGLGLLKAISSDVNVRLELKGGNLALDGTRDDFDFKYDVDIRLRNVQATIDWFVFSGALHLSSGLMINTGSLSADLTPVKSYTLGGRTYEPAELGSISTVMSFNKLVPYVGLGYGNPLGRNNSLSFTIDVGALFPGSPQIKMTGTGLIAPTASQAPDIENDLDSFRIYPVLVFGLNYRLY